MPMWEAVVTLPISGSMDRTTFKETLYPAGMDPRLAFGGLLKARDRIRIAYLDDRCGC